MLGSPRALQCWSEHMSQESFVICENATIQRLAERMAEPSTEKNARRSWESRPRVHTREETCRATRWTAWRKRPTARPARSMIPRPLPLREAERHGCGLLEGYTSCLDRIRQAKTALPSWACSEPMSMGQTVGVLSQNRMAEFQDMYCPCHGHLEVPTEWFRAVIALRQRLTDGCHSLRIRTRVSINRYEVPF